jgi:hypothetical protein
MMLRSDRPVEVQLADLEALLDQRLALLRHWGSEPATDREGTQGSPRHSAPHDSGRRPVRAWRSS